LPKKRPQPQKPGLKRCWKTGCKKVFNVAENTDKCCTYHSGCPVFGGNEKWWSCCPENGKFWEFDRFTAIPKCKVGVHECELERYDRLFEAHTGDEAANIHAAMGYDGTRIVATCEDPKPEQPKPEGGGGHHWMAMNNRAPIVAHMRALLPPDSQEAKGLALEIGSGTGAQLEALAEAYPGLKWRPSEVAAGLSVVRGFYEQGPDGPDAGHPVEKVRSLADLDKALAKFDNVLPAVELDGSKPFTSWPSAVTESAGLYKVLFCSNVVHIAPWAVAEGIFKGASAALEDGGSLVFHGPFKLEGKCVGAGHEQLWDEQMRGFDGEDWGIRDVSDMVKEAATIGLRLEATELGVGPAKNCLLRFVKERRV